MLADYANPGSLIIGIGNVGREDDGLGWAFVDWVESVGTCPEAELARRYQLHLEDADLISRFQRVLFVDCTRDPATETFTVFTPTPAFEVPFTSHALSVPTVLATCRQCFGRLPRARMLALRGHRFELAEGLTAGARRSLAAAVVNH